MRKSPRFDNEHEAVSPALPILPSEAELATAALARAAAAVGDSPMYGRVDVAPGPDGEPVVMELELIEPSLYFVHSTRALECFVDAIRKRLATPSTGDA